MNERKENCRINTPLRLPCGVTLPNRLAKAATSELLADAENQATAKHAALYKKWSDSGAGLLITGNVQIDYHHLEHPGNVVICGEQSDEQRCYLEEWSKAAKSNGSLVFMQLSHAGRQSSRLVNQHPFSPSDIPLKIPGAHFGKPVPLTDEQIEDLIIKFTNAAVIAKDTGFDGIQLHAAHGYLFSQFLSPKVNNRQDKWGGNLRSRSHFLLRTILSVRESAGAAYPIAVKLNASDFQRGGFTFEECVELCGWLDEASVDLIEISGGTYEQPKATGITGTEEIFDPYVGERNTVRESFFSKFVPEIKKRIKNAKIMVTGGLRTLDGIYDAIEHDEADIVGFARPLCTNPKSIGQLLNGNIQNLTLPGKELRLGPGIFSPRSKFKIMRALNAATAGAWYALQLDKMANGLEPDLSLSFFKALQILFSKEKEMAANLKSNNVSHTS